jgi:uncharacterized protein (TIGR03083 family)
MTDGPKPLRPIFTAHLFSKLEDVLVELLRSLDPNDWEKQTVAPKWKVKDVAAHLLDTQLRGLSICRDEYAAETPDGSSPAELGASTNRLNQEGVSVYRRLSPHVLISLMELASRQNCGYHQSLDPFAIARFPVSWAGEHESANWFNTAREYTERWHHQQQIRLAVQKPEIDKFRIMTRELYYPVLDCFMRALPFTYRAAPGMAGSFAQFNVSGECGGSWYLYRDKETWKLSAAPCGEKVSETEIPQEIAWRLFTKGIGRESAASQIHVRGDTKLGLGILEMIFSIVV